MNLAQPQGLSMLGLSQRPVADCRTFLVSPVAARVRIRRGRPLLNISYVATTITDKLDLTLR